LIYELRTYNIHPGKMEDIHRRFSTITLDLFKKHEMRTVDFWEDAEGKNVIYYILEHNDMEDRNRNFKSFQNDSEWIEAKRISELNGPIVEKIESTFMKRVPYSPANNKL
jgi:Na+-transporting NADH:ubiquinone oxidoreductase subunit NqrF